MLKELTHKEASAVWERVRLQRIAELQKLRAEVDNMLAVLARTPHPDDESERDLLDAAYAAFEVDALWDQARDFGPKREDA